MNSGNYLIDGDDGSHPMSPSYESPTTETLELKPVSETRIQYWKARNERERQDRLRFWDHYNEELINKVVNIQIFGYAK